MGCGRALVCQLALLVFGCAGVRTNIHAYKSLSAANATTIFMFLSNPDAALIPGDRIEVSDYPDLVWRIAELKGSKITLGIDNFAEHGIKARKLESGTGAGIMLSCPFFNH